ncbi:MAG: DUF3467 domain-containing protein [Deltaproteobacteria bacterium]|nr:DUF3467 domain-containing protein [Deltaproteobacteria bacterium]
MVDKSKKIVNTAQRQSQPRIFWESANARSVYANAFNVTGSQEEFILSFGMNQSWDAGGKEVKVQITDRVVMSPFAVKRLAKLLSDVVKNYESRYGQLQTETARAGSATNNKTLSRQVMTSAGRSSNVNS